MTGPRLVASTRVGPRIILPSPVSPRLIHQITRVVGDVMPSLRDSGGSRSSLRSDDTAGEGRFVHGRYYPAWNDGPAVVGAAVGIALMATRRLGRGTPIPFGPYLAGAAWIALVWGPAIKDRYLAFVGLG